MKPPALAEKPRGGDQLGQRVLIRSVTAPKPGLRVTFRTGDEEDTVSQVWFPMAPSLPGTHHDDPQVAVTRCHCTRHLFLLLSRRHHHPCKLPLPTMTFSLVPKSTLYLFLLFLLLLSCQRSGLGLGTEGRSLAWVGSPTVPQPAIGITPLGGCHTEKAPALALCQAKRRGRHSTVHSWSWRWSWHSSSLTPPRLLKRVTQKPWPNSTLTYFDMYTNQLFERFHLCRALLCFYVPV